MKNERRNDAKNINNFFYFSIILYRINAMQILNNIFLFDRIKRLKQ